MKGIFELQPPKLKVSTTWSVGTVVGYLQEMGPIESLSLQDLSLKLAMLLALTSAARLHELIALDKVNVTVKKDCWRSFLSTHVKNFGPNHPGREMAFSAYTDDLRICVVQCLEEYVNRTANIRQNEPQLLVSHKAPHKAISSQTLSRWLRTNLNRAGVSKEYTGHSTRSASTSEAAKSDLPIEIILEATDWSSANVFKNHYYKQPEGTFANTVLKSAKQYN